MVTNSKLSQALKGNTNAAKNHVKKAVGVVKRKVVNYAAKNKAADKQNKFLLANYKPRVTTGAPVLHNAETDSLKGKFKSAFAKVKAKLRNAKNDVSSAANETLGRVDRKIKSAASKAGSFARSVKYSVKNKVADYQNKTLRENYKPRRVVKKSPSAGRR